MSQFTQQVYSIVRLIPEGRVLTYRDVARLAGNQNAARAVGYAMSRNADPKTIPCHRVVGSDGSMHGYRFGKGVATKLSMLRSEGVVIKNGKVDVNASRHET